jgi:hypothetical protein
LQDFMEEPIVLGSPGVEAPHLLTSKTVLEGGCNPAAELREGSEL